MFLVDSAEATADWDGVETSIKNILDRAEAEIVSLRKWEERRLAYEIDGKSKGTYILCYFRADGKRIGDIERDVQLSERIMRVLILCAEHMTQEDIEKETPVVLAEREEEKAAEAVEVAVKETEAKQEIAQESEETQEEVLEVSGATAEESEELGEPAVVLEGDEERMETPEPAATGASESEQAQGAEAENDSEAADEQDEEGTEEK
jgi:small subunit ribosomal protein S6